VQYDTTINRWHTCPNSGRINASNPCSEYMFLDNTACNLASINLMKFRQADASFDVPRFMAACRLFLIAQEILVDHASYPTAEIARNSHLFRPLGLGYSNLGSLLMSGGMPYDSEAGYGVCGALTALLHGAANLTSAEIAAVVGPFQGYEANREPFLRVMQMHRDAVENINDASPAYLKDAAREVWERVLATLVGGGSIQIVNQTVPRALERLGYASEHVEEIVAWIAEHHSVLGAPHLDPAHVPVFACAMGDVTISYGGHLRMMAAIQPFFSGAMSKTVNLPESATIDEVEQLLIDAWRSGIKCVALYRDNCKVTQPLSVGSGPSRGADPVEPPGTGPVVVAHHLRPERERLPRTRRSRTFEFRVADCKGFVTVGEYDDGRPGELFIRVSKQGSTLAGIMDALAISVSHGLQYGVPLRAFVDALVGMRFEPAGITDDDQIRTANSLIDYRFRRLALEYLPYEDRLELGILATSERSQPTLPGVDEAAPPTVGELGAGPAPAPRSDAPLCSSCGVAMVRAGSCYTCAECGATSGCS